jgi:hypothetical protein
MTDAPEPEALRAAALATLGPHADERAREALQRAILRVDPAVTGWESSGGRVAGHRVVLELDVLTLARIRAVPALDDALHAALASAVASRAGHALSELELRWARSGSPAVSHGYRDRPPDPPPSLHEALMTYLSARGEPGLADLVRGASITLEGAALHVRVTPDALQILRSGGAGSADALADGARDLVSAELVIGT